MEVIILQSVKYFTLNLIVLGKEQMLNFLPSPEIYIF